MLPVDLLGPPNWKVDLDGGGGRDDVDFCKFSPTELE